MLATPHTTITHRPSTAGAPRRQKPHLLVEDGAFVVLRVVKSVRPREAIQQSARIGDHLPVVDRDEGDLEDGVGEIGVHGETSEARPNVLVGHRVLVGVVPSVGRLQRLHRADAAIVTRRVEGPGGAGAGSVDPVDGAELDGLECGVVSTVDGAHFLFPSWLVGLFCWYKNAPWALANTRPKGGGVLCHIVRVGWAAQSARSASTRSISRRSAASIRVAASSPSKPLTSFVVSVMMMRASRMASWTGRSAVKRRTSARAYW
uniref:Uncharacterized protein n=1 Tax=Siphoviridae sp. ct0eR1 TaxID=2825297 RepID=A0A8S5UHA6_9CAUD|nr:MAG TPA: hypothetical protein [Siphoviridae sp. ct0eR1]